MGSRICLSSLMRVMGWRPPQAAPRIPFTILPKPASRPQPAYWRPDDLENFGESAQSTKELFCLNMRWFKRGLALLISWCVVLTSTRDVSAFQTPQFPPQALQQGPEQLQQLVAPIALYPDTLIAQILAASTYPSGPRTTSAQLQRSTRFSPCLCRGSKRPSGPSSGRCQSTSASRSGP